jgi:hypothetical protein
VPRTTFPLGCAALAAITLTAAAAAADEPDESVRRKLAFLEDRLTRGEPAASTWWNAWYITYLAATAGQAAVAGAVRDRDLRADMAVGAVSSALGVVPLGLFDFPARYAGTALRARPARTPAERRAKLALGEKLLRESAEAEAFGRSWLAHLGCVGVSALSGLVLAVAYKRGVSSLITVATNLAVGELQVWTQPTAAVRDWAAYQQGTLGAPASAAPVRLGVALAPLDRGAAAALTLTF